MAIVVTGLLLASFSTPPPKLISGAETVRVGKSDPDASHQYVGEITAIDGNDCGAYGRRGTYQGAITNLRNQAYTMGADYVQITNQTESTSGKSKDQQVKELQQQNLPYAEYQRRYKEIMEQ